MRFQFTDAHNAHYSTVGFCAFMGVSCSAYCAWRKRPARARQQEDILFFTHIKGKFEVSNRAYGSRRIAAELSAEGLNVGRHHVVRLMRDNSLEVERKKKFKRTTDSHHSISVASSLPEQDFTCTSPNQKWGADISYGAPRLGLSEEAYVWNATLERRMRSCHVSRYGGDNEPKRR